ncbi:MAG TPA: GlsB/YeaQ/YmgE family stress response membrane protein [Actinomycetota bacterium]|nr:GlsB/YeaQ/YmgE family stress response membrane protein [Actinomycetota bacterium]
MENVGLLDVLWYAIAGLVIGVLARAIMPGRQEMSMVATIVLGVVAAIIGGYLWNAIFPDNEGVAWIGSIIVAIVLLWLYARLAPNLSRRRV